MARILHCSSVRWARDDLVGTSEHSNLRPRAIRLTRNVRIGRCLKRAQSITNDEDTRAKAAEATVDDGRDGKQRTDAVQKQTPDEHGPVAVMPQDPGGVAQ